MASSIAPKLARRAALHRGLAGVALCLAASVAGAGTARAQGEARRPLRLLMLGDSITAGYGLARAEGPPARLEALLRERGRDVTVLDAGVSGDTTAGGRARLGWALADRPDAVVVALGGNDLLRGTPPAETRANLAAILDGLAARGVPALLAGMYAPPNLGPEYGREFRDAYESLARERAGSVVFYPFLLDGVAGEPAMNQPDRIHPNARGAEEIARRMLPAVEALLDRAAAAPNG